MLPRAQWRREQCLTASLPFGSGNTYTHKRKGLKLLSYLFTEKKKGGKFYIEQDGAVEEKQGKQDDNVFSFLCISF